MLANLAAYDEVHIALRSKIVAMGMQVANIRLGGKIHVHLLRARLEADLKRVLRASGGSLPAETVARL